MSGSGIYTIRSLLKANPYVGVVSPPFPPDGGVGPVIVSEPVRVHGGGEWRLKQLIGVKLNNYEFSIVDKFEHTGVSKDVVVATDIKVPPNAAWNVQYVKHYDAYIIALADDLVRGWTASESSPEAYIKIAPILVGLSNPPAYSPAQLFKLHKLKPE